MNNILIVESGAKAKTLQRYLGDDWGVLATGGHIETLPFDRTLHGKDAGKAYWANRPGELPSPPWVWTERGEDAVRKILERTKSGDGQPTFWIATDPDREGEFIAWGLQRRLDEHGEAFRIAFQEVTEEALREAIDRPRGVDMQMVESALVRKFLDRLVGYRTANMVNAIVPGKSASMGRVQTPTLGFVVDRELEREAHVPIPYFEVRARAQEVEFGVRFHEASDEGAWKDEGGKPNPLRTLDRDLAEGASAALAAEGRITLTRVDTRTRQRQPVAPFTTDALLQAGGSRFGWSPKKTSALASMLYEEGHITYIRTDSARIASSAIEKARNVVSEAYGKDHLGKGAKAKASVGPTQDAHEAVRPSRLDVAEPKIEDADARRLYRLIRAHTLASQMAPSVRTVVSIEATCEGCPRPLTGSVSWRTFAGWEAAYAEFMGDVATAPPEVALDEGATWSLDGTDDTPNPLLIEDETKPPARYRPHTLIRAMKEAGIGRPSTYSRTVEKLEERDYVQVEDGSVVPTERGRVAWTEVAPLYAEDDPDDAPADLILMDLFSAAFTAEMEEELERVASGESEAPVTWELWRDRIRDLHETARKKRDSGEIVPDQKRTLKRLLANASESVLAEHGVTNPNDLSSLSYVDAHELKRALREAGVQPAPSESQREYLRSLIADLNLSEDELMAYVGLRSVDEVDRIETSGIASAAIDSLQQLSDERRPASAKQRRYIGDLLKKVGISDAEAAEQVGVTSLDDLTGGNEGSASELLNWLKERAAATTGQKTIPADGTAAD